MPQTTLYDRTGKTVGSVELSDELFAAPINAAVLHQVVTAQLAGRRTGHRTTPRPAARSAAAARSRTARRAPAAPARASQTAPALPRRRRRLRPASALATSSACRAR